MSITKQMYNSYFFTSIDNFEIKLEFKFALASIKYIPIRIFPICQRCLGNFKLFFYLKKIIPELVLVPPNGMDGRIFFCVHSLSSSSQGCP